MMCLHSQHVHMSLPNSVATEEGNWVPGGGGGGGGGTKFFFVQQDKIHFSSFLLRYLSLQYFYLENLPLTYHKLFVCLFSDLSSLGF